MWSETCTLIPEHHLGRSVGRAVGCGEMKGERECEKKKKMTAERTSERASEIIAGATRKNKEMDSLSLWHRSAPRETEANYASQQYRDFHHCTGLLLS